MIERSRLDYSGMWKREKLVGALVDVNYNSTSGLVDGVKFIGGKKDGFVFYGIKLKNTDGKFISRKPVKVLNSHISFFDKDGNPIVEPKECRWWNPDTPDEEKLFSTEPINLHERRIVNIPAGDWMYVVIACRTVILERYYAFGIDSDKREKFMLHDDLLYGDYPYYFRLNIHCENGEIVKRFLIEQNKDTKKLIVSECRKFPFPEPAT